MCPCPFCASIAILLCPLLLFKRSRKWLKSKITQHHCACDVCQKAEHKQHLRDHTPCHCRECAEKSVASVKKRCSSSSKRKIRKRKSKKVS